MRFYKYIVSFILFATFIFATIDTHWFVYPALSRSLSMEIGMLTFALLILPFGLASKSLPFSKYDMLALAWIGYIAIHALLTNPHETYRTIYLCNSLLFLVLLSTGIRKGIVQRTTVENCILAAAIIHLIYIAGQSFGIIGSGNSHFFITGSNENPTVTALYLTACIPLIVSRIRKGVHRIYFAIFLLAAFSAIICLRCRTAYVGLIVEFIVCIVAYRKIILSKITKYIRYKSIFIIALATVSIFSLTQLYLMKKDSADGRLFIWKISLNMIAEKPLGYGYGLFEKNFNLKQSEYFERGKYSKTEKRNADFVYMAYNDYLEHGIEGGIFGMMFLCVFYCITIRKTVRGKRTGDTAVIIAFTVMSLTNFVYSSIQPWLILMCYAAFSDSTTINKSENKNKIPDMIMTSALLVVTFSLMYKTASMAKAQYQLNNIENIRKEAKTINDKFYSDIEHEISTSEAFWKSRASNHMANKEFKNAITAIHKARLYSSSPQLLYREKHCQMLLGDTACAIKVLTTLSYMRPKDLALKHELMIFHDMAGDKALTLHYANDILTTDSKRRTSRNQSITNHALKIKKRYEK